MDGIKLGVVLRDSFEAGDEVDLLLQSMPAERIVLDMRFRGKPTKSPITPLHHISTFFENVPWLKSIPYSVLIPSIYKHIDHDRRIAFGLHDEVFSLFPSNLLYLEVSPAIQDELELTREFVTNFLALRPDNRIGIVSGVSSFLGEPFAAQYRSLFGSDERLFPCPIIVGATSQLVAEPLEASARELPGSVPFLFQLSLDDRRQLPELLARHEGDFEEIIFWTPWTVQGIDFEEVQMSRRKSIIKKPIQATIGDDVPVKIYTAKQPVARRESPSKTAHVKGTIEVDHDYEVVQPPILDNLMGIQYGLLKDGDYVILKEGEIAYFEEKVS